jgi:hypothetical protein
MTFIGLVWHNVSARRMRAALTAGAVAIGVMAVVALGTLTSSLEQSATGFLKAGNADFTIAQKHTDSLLNSLISSDDIASIAKVDGVEDSIGALIELDKYDAGHPTVVQVGLAPDAQKRFGVVVLEGRSYAAQSETEVMLGYTLAESIDKDRRHPDDGRPSVPRDRPVPDQRRLVRQLHDDVPAGGAAGPLPGSRPGDTGVRQAGPGASCAGPQVDRTKFPSWPR